MIVRLFKLFLIVFFFSITNQFSQQVKTINILTQKLKNDDFIKETKKFINSQISLSLIDSVKRKVANILIGKSYYTFKIDSVSVFIPSDSLYSEISVFINEGYKTFIKDFTISGLDIEDSLVVYEKLSFLKEDELNKELIENTFNDILNDFENSGHPFSSITIKSIISNTDSSNRANYASIYLEFNKREKSGIDSIKIEGNTKTKDFVILRAIGLKKGDEYNQEKIDLIPNRLNRLRFFEPVQIPEYFIVKNGKGILNVIIKEAETNNFDGVLGYVPAANDKEKGYFVGYVNFNLRNIFGTGRGANFKWQQINRYSQELELKYLEPWLFDYPLNVNLNLYQKKQDTTYVQRLYGGSLEYLATEDISTLLSVSLSTTIPTENLYSKFTVYNSSIFSSGLSFIMDTRDDFYAPRQGLYFNTGYKFSTKKINGPIKYLSKDTKTKTELQKYELDFEFFYEIFYRQIFALTFHLKELKGDLIEVSDLFELGGNNTLRGYRERQFLGNRVMWSNLEYRALLTRRSYAFLFIDNGYILRNADLAKQTEKQTLYKYGYGFGLSLETGVGVLKVSYAIAGGGNINEGFIHFGIANEF
ncbi:MAG TPA: BamA/TamA family outer membrane protein [Melioribacteraceae bacterium]|nr:BamA/TamA family outer membrane protein [Melioribacteraceae bacterium]